jgi:hypothetical protein
MCIIFNTLLKNSNSPFLECNLQPHICKQVTQSQIKLHQEIESEGYTIPAGALYVNYETNIDLVCPNGHLRPIKPSRWDRQKVVGCPECNKIHKTNITRHQKINELLLIHGFSTSRYVLSLDSQTTDLKSKIKLTCPNGEFFEVFPYQLKNSKGCKCSKCDTSTYHFNAKPEQFYQEISKSGYTLLQGQIYINDRTKLSSTCPSSNIYNINPNSFMRGVRCNCIDCRTSKNKYKSANQTKIQSHALSIGFQLGPNYEYLGIAKQGQFQCPSGNLFYFSNAYFLRKHGCTCQDCYLKDNTRLRLKFSPYHSSMSFITKRIAKRSTLELEEILDCLNKEALQAFYRKTPIGHHVDHFIPFSSFDMNNPEHVKMCWSIENLQYLPALVNMQKHNKLSTHDLGRINANPALRRIYQLVAA